MNFHAKKNRFSDRTNETKYGIIPAQYFEYIISEDLLHEVAALNGEVRKKTQGSRFDAVQRKADKRKVSDQPKSLKEKIKDAVAKNA